MLGAVGRAWFPACCHWLGGDALRVSPPPSLPLTGDLKLRTAQRISRALQRQNAHAALRRVLEFSGFGTWGLGATVLSDITE